MPLEVMQEAYSQEVSSAGFWPGSKEFPFPAFEDLKSPETWAHRHPIILQAGRCSHFVPASVNPDDRDDYKAQLEDKDPPVERYRTLNEDNPWKNLDPPTAWTSKVVGD